MTVWYFNLLQLIYPGRVLGLGKPGIIVIPAKGFGKGKAWGKHFIKQPLNYAREIKNTCTLDIVQRGSLRRRQLGSLQRRPCPREIGRLRPQNVLTWFKKRARRETSVWPPDTLSPRWGRRRRSGEISIWLFFLFFLRLSSSSLHLLILKPIFVFLSFPL